MASKVEAGDYAMSTLSHQLRTTLRMQSRLVKEPIFLWTMAYFIFLLVTIFIADPTKPRLTFYYAEMGMFPLIIMVMTVLLGREFGGGGMEMIATYPVSLRWLAFRKWLGTLIYIAMANIIWMIAYIVRFGKLEPWLYTWGEGTKVVSENAFFALFMQGLPAYMLMASLVLLGTVIFQKTYGGLLFGFSLWAIDTLSGGGLLRRFTLYANLLEKDTWFTANRIALLLLTALLLAITLWLTGLRERWIGKEEE